MVIRRVGGRLDDEDVLAAHILVDLDKDLYVREAPHAGFGQRQAKTGGHRLGERPIAVAGQDFHAPWQGGRRRRPGPAASRARDSNKATPGSQSRGVIKPSTQPRAGRAHDPPASWVEPRAINSMTPAPA